MSGYHAKIAPSALALTVKCNAWIQLSEGLPPEADTPDTLEGNASDWVAKQAAQGVVLEYGTPTPVPGYTIDYDMLRGARLWQEALGPYTNHGTPVMIERIHSEHCWGEPDAWRWDSIEGVLRVWDYKYGFGIVDEWENWQLMAYAIGLLDTLGLDDQTTKVEMTVVQPRAYSPRGPVRKRAVMGDALRPYAITAHDAAVSALRKPGEILWNKPLEAVSGVHCLNCPARVQCGTYQQTISHVLEYAGTATKVELPPNATGVELLLVEDAIKMLEGRHTALHARADAFVRATPAQPVVNWGLVPASIPTKWKPGVTVEELKALGASIGKDLCKPTKVDPNSRNSPIITPTQAIAAGVDEAVMGEYSERPPAGRKLARVTLTDAQRAFGDNPA